MSQVSAFGYRQELQRSMGRFSSFAVSFSLISVLTGVFANFDFGIRQAGGDIVWTWLVVAAGQTLVALVMANLAVRFPIAGYGYQWAARLAGTDFGFFVGWMLLMQFVTGFPGVCQTFVAALFGLIGLDTGPIALVAGTVGAITLVALIHLFGIRVAAKVNDLGVYTEILGIVGLVAALAYFWSTGAGIRTDNLVEAVCRLGEGVSRLSGLTLSLLLGAWCLTGFEAAADLAEETKSPTTSVPRSVMLSHLAASVSGFLILALLVANAGGLAPGTGDSGTLMRILEGTLGVRLSSLVVIFVVLSVFACAVAAMATASRLLFSMARDRVLPFSPWIAKVDAGSRTPRNAVLLVWGFGIASILTLKRVETITNVSALASYIGYAGIITAALAGKRTGAGTFVYGPRWERTVQFLALVWTVLIAMALAIPETEVAGFETRHLPAVSTGMAIGVGLMLYIFHVRRKIRDGIAGPPETRQ